MYAKFEWDPSKAATNLRKHGIDFYTALRAFADPFAFSERDRVEDVEERWRTLGLVDGHLLVLVIHTFRDEEEQREPFEIIRIISARKADRKERLRYEQENRSSHR